jgi:hypothetical protein
VKQSRMVSMARIKMQMLEKDVNTIYLVKVETS